MSHCLIVSAGPSLRTISPNVLLHPLATVLAVNRAALRLPLHTVDWIIAGDITTCSELSKALRLPRQGFCLLDATADLITQGHCPFWTSHDGKPVRPVIRWSTLSGWKTAWCRDGRAEGFSSTAAFALALRLAFSTARLAGHDCAVDAPDCAGHGDENRSADRWRREAAEHASFLAAHALSILRLTPYRPTLEHP